ncbi:FAD-dependent oxidoreductase [Streptomyces sp. NPDC004539]|uniref:oxidoreductase n=1 Tax=Streptomyces sp. NPDC004539 TaxID=3154280 RepID=UPI00339FF3C7
MPNDLPATGPALDEILDGGRERYPKLFGAWRLRNTPVRNRVVFPPTCATWVTDGLNGVFTDMAVDYYAERAKGGVGLILMGATHVHPSSLAAPLAVGQLFDDRNIEPLSRIAEAVHSHGAKIGIQLWHSGVRGHPFPKMEPGYDPDATWHTVGPSQVPLGEGTGGVTPKELTDAEIEEILDAYASAASRAVTAGLDGVEFHLSHGYLAWQFLSPLYNKRTDRWGGSYENRLRFPVEAMRRIREAIGDEPFLGYRVNSTSFWPNDLETEQVTGIVADLEARLDIDYVSVSAGVHHAFIHTPMHFEAGWEHEYAKAVKDVSSKPVFMVGRFTTPEQAEAALDTGDADAILLARQMFADPEWAVKAASGHAEDIRRCVAANHCWRSVIRGARVQCVYNPTIGREGRWGAGTLIPVRGPKRIVVVGAGPAGLEYARIAAARGHDVTVLEAEEHVGGHAHLQSLLPGREEYRRIGTWLADQARRNGAKISLSSPVRPDGVDALLDSLAPDHVVIATGSRVRADGFQGWTGEPLPGWESGRCVGWDDVVTGRVRPRGDVLVVDDTSDLVAPLVACRLQESGARATVVTRWPMLGIENLDDVYFEWLMPRVYESGTRVIVDHFVERIEGARTVLHNVHRKSAEQTVGSDWIVMVTARTSVDDLNVVLAERGVSVETIGDAVAPRSTYEAVYEGHRAARRII